MLGTDASLPTSAFGRLSRTAGAVMRGGWMMVGRRKKVDGELSEADLDLRLDG